MQRQSWQVLCLAILIGSLTLTACSPSSDTTDQPKALTTSTVNPFATYIPRLEGKALVEMMLEGEGDRRIVIELNGKDAPITAGNFADLVKRGVYDGLAFHRVIREPEPFVAQGGDPSGSNPNISIDRLGTGGYVDPQTNVRRDLPLEIKLDGSETPLYGRANLDGTKVTLKHEKGTIAMARSQSPNSASAQFYFTLAELSFLDGNYAVFGKVTEGIVVVDNIQMGDRIKSAKVVEIQGELVTAE